MTKICALCRRVWDVSVLDKRNPYICPHCESRERDRAELDRVEADEKIGKALMEAGYAN